MYERREIPLFGRAQHACFTCRHVLEENRPIRYVSHDEDGYWQFLCGGNHTEEDARVVSLVSVWEMDESVGELAGLDYGESAEAADPADGWVIARKGKNMHQKQQDIAQNDMAQWLADPYELGKEPGRIECAGEFGLHGMRYYIFKFKTGVLSPWLVGVSGGYEGDSLTPCGHTFSEMKSTTPPPRRRSARRWWKKSAPTGWRRRKNSHSSKNILLAARHAEI